MIKLRVPCLLFVSLLLAMMGCSQNIEVPVAPQIKPDPELLGRVVYEGTADSDNYVVKIPEIDLDDMPMVSVYVPTSNLMPYLWTEIPFDTKDYVFHQGVMQVRGCSGLPFIVVLMK